MARDEFPVDGQGDGPPDPTVIERRLPEVEADPEHGPYAVQPFGGNGQVFLSGELLMVVDKRREAGQMDFPGLHGHEDFVRAGKNLEFDGVQKRQSLEEIAVEPFEHDTSARLIGHEAERASADGVPVCRVRADVLAVPVDVDRQDRSQRGGECLKQGGVMVSQTYDDRTVVRGLQRIDGLEHGGEGMKTLHGLDGEDHVFRSDGGAVVEEGVLPQM